MINCLMVDDDTDDQEIFAMALGQIDETIRCRFANDGYEGLAKLADTIDLPEIIFLDLNMPRMGGKEFLKEIKQKEHLKDIPVVIYSTSGDQYFQQEVKALGAAGYIVKTSTMGSLLDVLKKIFSEFAHL